mmetsp:Transcript_3189/g.5742  ORF Transcript_3189/g.5742 Transcript_3189/m.5742 type:complete len:277 (+) Transcript_3189:33-863(+)|eukprot:CAMPEP_0202687764 /NCGR_PEP_ID=MMETSP1385-20130828/3390_1 /ASSEMBLY_ACC=CAM_ASM_000861 /TAXON_ID=933848 /ORGANISM="Elphidium margaritaceum" /LENGTH=276 /DNA_ID=CAMNT_0049342607 /DNA_START=31 /DNA_END=861 /DNA_ORIENTATION=+
MDSKDVAYQRVQELETQIQSLTLELRNLKRTLPLEAVSQVPQVRTHAVNDDDAKMVMITPAHLTAAGQRGSAPNPSQYKVLAMEYCQKTHMAKPVESITENKDFQVCWNFASAKGCTRRDCRWRHVEEAQLYGTVQSGKQQVEKKRFTAKVSISDQSALGNGASKRTALNEAYRRLTESMDISQKIAQIQRTKVSKPALTMPTEKTAKSKLMEFAQKRKLPAPAISYTSTVDVSANSTIWTAKVVFNGKTVESQDVRKKIAEEKCCAQLLERLNSQ